MNSDEVKDINLRLDDINTDLKTTDEKIRQLKEELINNNNTLSEIEVTNKEDELIELEVYKQSLEKEYKLISEGLRNPSAMSGKSFLDDSTSIISLSKDTATGRYIDTFENIKSSYDPRTGAEFYGGVSGSRVYQDPATIKRLREQGTIHSNAGFINELISSAVTSDEDMFAKTLPMFFYEVNPVSGIREFKHNNEGLLIHLIDQNGTENIFEDMIATQEATLASIISDDNSPQELKDLAIELKDNNLSESYFENSDYNSLFNRVKRYNQKAIDTNISLF